MLINKRHPRFSLISSAQADKSGACEMAVREETCKPYCHLAFPLKHIIALRFTLIGIDSQKHQLFLSCAVIEATGIRWGLLYDTLLSMDTSKRIHNQCIQAPSADIFNNNISIYSTRLFYLSFRHWADSYNFPNRIPSLRFPRYRLLNPCNNIVLRNNRLLSTHFINSFQIYIHEN